MKSENLYHPSYKPQIHFHNLYTKHSVQTFNHFQYSTFNLVFIEFKDFSNWRTPKFKFALEKPWTRKLAFEVKVYSLGCSGPWSVGESRWFSFIGQNWLRDPIREVTSSWISNLRFWEPTITISALLGSKHVTFYNKHRLRHFQTYIAYK